MDDELFCLNLFQSGLCRKIYPAFHRELEILYEKAVHTRVQLKKPLVLEKKDKDGKISKIEVPQYREPILPMDFQTRLEEVHLWNHHQIEELFTKVCAGEKPLVEKSIEAVFAYATKLACASANIPPEVVNVSIPDGSHFIHTVFIEVCRRVYRCPFIIHTTGMDAIQQYQMQLEPVVKDSMTAEIERMLPTANILQNLNFGADPREQEEHVSHQNAPLDLSRADLHYQYPTEHMPEHRPIFIAPSPPQVQSTVPTLTQMAAPVLPQPISVPSTSSMPNTTTTVTTTTAPPPMLNSNLSAMLQSQQKLDGNESEEDEEATESSDEERDTGAGDQKPRDSSTDAPSERKQMTIKAADF